jgi:hypothetical protein
MKKLHYLKNLIFLSCLLFVALRMQSQDLVQESTDWKKLRFQPSVSVSFPMAIDLQNPILPVGVNLDAYYEMSKIADFRAGLQYGTFKGVSVGGTYHLADKQTSKMTRFIVAETGRKIYFFKNNSEYRTVFGPTANLQIGSYLPTGFYARFDGGVDFQKHSRAYFKGYPSSKNGFSSIKLMATVVKLNQPEDSDLGTLIKSRVGVGASAGYIAEIKPWKRFTFFGSLDIGYISLLGVKDHVTQYYTTENTKWMIIGTAKAGVSVSL